MPESRTETPRRLLGVSKIPAPQSGTRFHSLAYEEEDVISRGEIRTNSKGGGSEITSKTTTRIMTPLQRRTLPRVALISSSKSKIVTHRIAADSVLKGRNARSHHLNMVRQQASEINASRKEAIIKERLLAEEKEQERRKEIKKQQLKNSEEVKRRAANNAKIRQRELDVALKEGEIKSKEFREGQERLQNDACERRRKSNELGMKQSIMAAEEKVRRKEAARNADAAIFEERQCASEALSAAQNEQKIRNRLSQQARKAGIDKARECDKENRHRKRKEKDAEIALQTGCHQDVQLFQQTEVQRQRQSLVRRGDLVKQHVRMKYEEKHAQWQVNVKELEERNLECRDVQKHIATEKEKSRQSLCARAEVSKVHRCIDEQNTLRCLQERIKNIEIRNLERNDIEAYKTCEALKKRQSLQSHAESVKNHRVIEKKKMQELKEMKENIEFRHIGRKDAEACINGEKQEHRKIQQPLVDYAEAYGMKGKDKSHALQEMADVEERHEVGPLSREQLQALGRRELQALAKTYCVKANLKTALIIDQLIDIM